MNDIGAVIINAFALVVLAFIWRNYLGKIRYGKILDQFFVLLLVCNAVLVVTVPALINLWGISGGFVHTLLYIIQTLDFFFGSFLSMVWLYYCIFRTIPDTKESVFIKYIIPIPLVLLLITLIVSLTNGYIFSITDINRYRRGPGFFYTISVSYLYILSAIALVIIKRKRLSTGEFFPYLMMPLIPTVLGLLELFINTPPYIVWPATALVLLSIQMHVLDNRSHKDHLTGLNSRMALDEYLKKRINVEEDRRKTLAIIMLDLNRFKVINDVHGHTEGDRALRTASQILTNCMKGKDFIGRYGGDEFTIAISGCEQSFLTKIVQNIESETKRMNESLKRPYDIDFSIGSFLYKPDEFTDVHDMMAKVDVLMYEDKKKKHAWK